MTGKGRRIEGTRELRERETVGARRREEREGEGGKKSGPFDGAFVGSRGALRFATKIAPFASQSSPVICCEFINVTIGYSVPPRR